MVETNLLQLNILKKLPLKKGTSKQCCATCYNKNKKTCENQSIESTPEIKNVVCNNWEPAEQPLAGYFIEQLKNNGFNPKPETQPFPSTPPYGYSYCTYKKPRLSIKVYPEDLSKIKKLFITIANDMLLKVQNGGSIKESKIVVSYLFNHHSVFYKQSKEEDRHNLLVWPDIYFREPTIS